MSTRGKWGLIESDGNSNRDQAVAKAIGTKVFGVMEFFLLNTLEYNVDPSLHSSNVHSLSYFGYLKNLLILTFLQCLFEHP